MQKIRSNSVDMLNGPLLPNIWAFSVPLMLTNLLQMLFQAADTVVVGRFAGQQALAAVGATGSLCFLLIALFNGLSMGSNVLIARYIGAGNYEKIEKSVHTSIAMSLYCGLFLVVVGFFMSRPMLELMSTPSDIIDMSELYMRIYFVSAFFGLIYTFGSSILRSKGDTRRPLFFLFASGTVNVLNLLFVIVFQMSVAGVALATVISQVLAAALVCITLIRESDATHLDLRKLHIDRSMALEIIRIGVPAGLQGMAFSLSNVVVQSSINSFGSSVIVAGNSASNNIENFVYIGMSAFTQACITFTSQNVGAKNLRRVKSIFNHSMVLTTLSAMLMGFLVWFFGEFLLSFYTNDPAVVEAGMLRLFWVSMFLFLNGVLDVFVSSMRGMGYSSLPTIVMLAGIRGVRLIWLLLIFPLHRTLVTIYLCFPLSWTITSIVLGFIWLYCYRHMMRTNGEQAEAN